MHRHTAQPIADLLRQYLSQQQLQTPLAEHRLLQAWPEVVGPAVAARTGRIFLRNGTLHVQIRSAALRHTLTLAQAQLVAQLNRAARQPVITAIHFC